MFGTRLMDLRQAFLAGDRRQVFRGDAVHPGTMRGLAVPRIAGDPAVGAEAVELPRGASRSHRVSYCSLLRKT